MVQAIFSLEANADRILTIVKGKYGLKNKSDAANFIIDKFGEELLEPELRPEFIEKIRKIEKNGKFKEYSSLEQFRRTIEHA